MVKKTDSVKKLSVKSKKKPELIHVRSPNCWCDPYVDYVDLSTGTIIWTHRMEQ